jgi:hypothetical protein
MKTMNIVDQAQLAWEDHAENHQKEIRDLTGGDLTLIIGMKALWKLGWIRRETSNENHEQ